MAKNIFIFGAGASAHAGVPLMKNFFDIAVEIFLGYKPDDESKNEFRLIIDNYFNSFRKIYANFNFEPEIKNIETIFSLIDMLKLSSEDSLNNELSQSIIKFITRTIERKTVFSMVSPNKFNKPKEYCYFSEKILQHHQKIDICIITFNYDIALDTVIRTTFGSDSINYGLEREPNKSIIKLFKLHGSINFGICSDPDCLAITPISSPITNDIAFAYDSFIVPISDLISKNVCRKCKARLQSYPLIIPPTWNKSENKNISAVWNNTLKELSNAENIFIIGYSLPKTDLFFHYLLALGTLEIKNFKRFWVFDIDDEVNKKYSSFLSNDMKRKYMFNGPKHDSSFNNFINLLGIEDKSILGI
jgi:NAD-dependent SIR2 family protein deacetylase